MRVTLIGPAHPLRGGIAHHVYYLKRELTDCGHIVQVISFRKLYPHIFFPGTSEVDTSHLELDAEADPLLTPLNPISWMKAFKAVKAFAPDAVIFQWWHPFFAPVVGTLVRAFRRIGLKCVVDCHNVFPHEASVIDHLLLKFALSPADHFITHSLYVKKELLSFNFRGSIGVSRLPQPSELSGTKKHQRDGRTILFFGKVRRYKGLDVLLSAMPKVLSRVECDLMVVGEFYESADKYLRLIQEYGLERHVHVDNRYVPNEEVAGIFDHADVLILPYVTATQSAVAQLAFSNALPVIASKCGGLEETVIENFNGLLFPAGDSVALADQIISFFTNNLGPVLTQNLSLQKNGGVEDKPSELVESMIGGK